MKIYAEIYPSSNINKLKEYIKYLEAFDGFDIPDNPLGYPTMPPELIGYIIRNYYNDKEIIMNQRLIDINELKLISIIKAAKSINSSIIFTQGDDPLYGNKINDLTSENALKISLSRDVRSGLIISFNKNKTEIEKRLRLNADMFLCVNFNNISLLKSIETKRLMPYIIIGTDKNKNILERIKQPYIRIKELDNYIESLKCYNLYGILLSVPGDKKSLREISNYGFSQ